MSRVGDEGAGRGCVGVCRGCVRLARGGAGGAYFCFREERHHCPQVAHTCLVQVRHRCVRIDGGNGGSEQSSRSGERGGWSPIGVCCGHGRNVCRGQGACAERSRETVHRQIKKESCDSTEQAVMVLQALSRHKVERPWRPFAEVCVHLGRLRQGKGQRQGN